MADFTDNAIEEAGEKPMDKNHQDFLSADQYLTFVPFQTFYNDAGRLIGRHSFFLSRIHHTLLLTLFIQGMPGYAGSYSPGRDEGDVYILTRHLRTQAFIKSVEGMFGCGIG